jgi:hypothetical protein
MKLSHGVNTDFQDSKYKGLTEKIIKIFYRVYNRLGYGFLEKVYENAMATDIEVGLLLNFGPEPGIKRKVFDNFRK